MLKKLDRHIVVTIIASTLVVLFALLSIELLAQLIKEVEDLGKKDYTFTKLLAYVFGIIPMKLTLYFPMALLIGALMGLGKLAATSELTVMQVVGISRLRIGVLGFFIAVIMGSLIIALTEFVGVELQARVTEARAEALDEVTNNYGRLGIWAQDGNTFVNIRGVAKNGELANLRFFILNDDAEFERIRHASRAKTEEGRWILRDITDRFFTPKAVMIEKTKEMVWENRLDNSILELLLADAENLSIRDLHRYINYQQSNGVRPTTYSLEFWQRLFLPLSTGVMFLLALPFVFGSQRNTSQGRKLFIGIMLGLIYYVSYTSIANIILLTGAPVFLGAVIPIVLFTLVSFVLLWLRG